LVHTIATANSGATPSLVFDVQLLKPEVALGKVHSFVLNPHRRLYVGEWVQASLFQFNCDYLVIPHLCRLLV
jgi:hypothetical protein